MSDAVRTFRLNAEWELTRWRRSQRGWLLVIPPIAGPIGSAIADVYLRIPSQATAQILGLLIVGGLAGLILLDLVALAVGEDLTLRAHVTFFALPQSRLALIAGRLAVVLAGILAGYALAAAEVWYVSAALVAPDPYLVPIFSPWHLALSVFGFLVFLAGITAAGAVYTRASSQGLVAGVLAGVVVAGGTGYLLALHELTLLFPVGLAVVGAGALVWSVIRDPTLAA